MSRSLKKGLFVHPSILKKISAMNASGKKTPIKTWSRSSIITDEMIGHTFQVHNGKTFKDVYVIENMVGHKLGEFSPTRTFRGHGGKMAKDQAAAAAAAGKAAVAKAQADTK
ncbi:MAG: 30S ribosomal protein S19 [Candidatus Kerfeldbacteria bacterium]|nr:30S ribosomal protein S19 [Candidatus Kerfeldbacteria bacterium]